MKNEKLTKEEIHQMFLLIKRYTETEMDQWDLWQFDSNKGKVYVEISYRSNAHEEAYFDISSKLEK